MPSRLIATGLAPSSALGIASSVLAADPPPLTLDTITVTATRTERALRDVAGSVTVIDETRVVDLFGYYQLNDHARFNWACSTSPTRSTGNGARRCSAAPATTRRWIDSPSPVAMSP